MQNISWSKTMGNWGKNDPDPVQKTIPVKEKVIQDFTKEKQELKELCDDLVNKMNSLYDHCANKDLYDGISLINSVQKSISLM